MNLLNDKSALKKTNRNKTNFKNATVSIIRSAKALISFPNFTRRHIISAVQRRRF